LCYIFSIHGGVIGASRGKSTYRLFAAWFALNNETHVWFYTVHVAIYVISKEKAGTVKKVSALFMYKTFDRGTPVLFI